LDNAVCFSVNLTLPELLGVSWHLRPSPSVRICY
jgi:hypothetical protein